MIKKSKKEIGLEGEDLAIKFLQKKGYKIIQKNYSCNIGEIDIVAIHNKIIVFVEVKIRSSKEFGEPELAVTRHKRRQIVRVAETYLFSKNIENRDCRFDVVAINYSDKNNSPEIKLLENAFQADNI